MEFLLVWFPHPLFHFFNNIYGFSTVCNGSKMLYYLNTMCRFRDYLGMPFFLENKTSNRYSIVLAKIFIYIGPTSSSKFGISWNRVAPNSNEQFQGRRRCRFLSAKMTVEINIPCPKFLCRKSTGENELATQLHLFLQAKKKKKILDRGLALFWYLEMSRETSEGGREGGWVGEKLKH